MFMVELEMNFSVLNAPLSLSNGCMIFGGDMHDLEGVLNAGELLVC